jgi:hypothetical protein
MLVDNMMTYLAGKVKYHQANVRVYLTNPVGIGEHPDIMAAIEEELEKAASYQEKLDQLGDILMGGEDG